jgi:structure-specific recognition protein 1
MATSASKGKAGKGAAKGTPSRSKSKGKGKEAAKEETKSGKKAKKAEKEEDVGKPTRALSAYIYFSNETVPKLKQDEGIAHKDAMGKAGQIWNTLTDDKKKKFDELHDADVQR